ncbi:MAG TPA: hypothetical protein VJN18_14435 [Polyangiaceae bacterium]|nr:hypothetical protein [Polyangiaceae bacterium]
MSTKEPKQISTAQMRALLEKYPTISPASRKALIEGVCPFDDGEGGFYQAFATFKDDRATHHMHAAIDPVLTHGVPKCKRD